MPYLADKYGGQSLLIGRLERQNETFRSVSMHGRRNSFKDFYNKTENATEDGKYKYYIKNEMIINKELTADFQKPLFISTILRNRLTGLTIWGDF